MSVASDFNQLAHLVRLSAEELQNIESLPQELLEQLKALAEQASIIAAELDRLAISVVPLLTGTALQT